MVKKKDVKKSTQTFNNVGNSEVGKFVDSLVLLSQQGKKPTQETIEKAKNYISDGRVGKEHKSLLNKFI